MARSMPSFRLARVFAAAAICPPGATIWPPWMRPRRPARRDGIDSRAILTAIRHFGYERARKTAICAAETAGGWVTGLGIGGAEDAGNLRDFAWSYDCAREGGAGPDRACRAIGRPRHDPRRAGCWARIGHGIRAPPRMPGCCANWPRVRSRRVCPGSNVALGAVAGGPHIPSRAFSMPACG